MAERKKVLLRLDPAVHDALARWAGDELRSTNAQIEFLLRRALADAGRMPASAGRMRGRGRPRKSDTDGRDDTEDENDPPGGGGEDES
ncbi:hypothetical protein D0T12_24725 [Actinomadura spongiicola]|uniref:Toxin-antitoxin system HicB family antitoxin n=1 Tax=Actinomadura spongiicola TaxID=2303421 RepID=A0A372GBZ8_9ACTN|nr:hypothetical protein [Actinomadura spongiicola]RFS82662.1 hypothetical protein D0T12_24725 [Actinomadura spongiicola]